MRLRHTESGIDIDMILSGLPFEAEAVSRDTVHDVGGVRVRLPQVEELLMIKAIAHRPQDLRDIERLLDVFPGADVESVRRGIRDLAAAAELPDLPEEFEKLLAQREARSPSTSDPPQAAGKNDPAQKKDSML